MEEILYKIYSKGRSSEIKTSDFWSDFFYSDELNELGYSGELPINFDQNIIRHGFEIKLVINESDENDPNFMAYSIRPLDKSKYR